MIDIAFVFQEACWIEDLTYAIPVEDLAETVPTSKRTESKVLWKVVPVRTDIRLTFRSQLWDKLSKEGGQQKCRDIIWEWIGQTECTSCTAAMRTG
jgi:hypothetical protein